MARHYRDVHKLSDDQRKEMRKEVNAVQSTSHVEAEVGNASGNLGLEMEGGDILENIVKAMELPQNLGEEDQGKIRIGNSYPMLLDDKIEDDFSLVVTMDPDEDSPDNLLAMLLNTTEENTWPTVAIDPGQQNKTPFVSQSQPTEEKSLSLVASEARRFLLAATDTKEESSPLPSEDMNSPPMLTDPLTGELYVDGIIECPICCSLMLKSVVAKHCADVHNSPVHKTRKKKSISSNSVKISISQDSPARIRNKDSPIKASQSVSPPSQVKGKRSLLKSVTLADQVSVEGETKTTDFKGSVDDNLLVKKLPDDKDDEISVLVPSPPESHNLCQMPDIKLVVVSEPSKSNRGSFVPVVSSESESSESESASSTPEVPESSSPSPVPFESFSLCPVSQMGKISFVPSPSVSSFPKAKPSLLPDSPMVSPSLSLDLARQSGNNSPLIPQESWSALDNCNYPPTPPLKLMRSGKSGWKVAPSPASSPAAKREATPLSKLDAATPSKLNFVPTLKISTLSSSPASKRDARPFSKLDAAPASKLNFVLPLKLSTLPSSPAKRDTTPASKLDAAPASKMNFVPTLKLSTLPSSPPAIRDAIPSSKLDTTPASKMNFVPALKLSTFNSSPASKMEKN